MAFVSLSTRDVNVLEKIKDPESNPDAGIFIDDSLPHDPQVTDAALYSEVTAKEVSIIREIQQAEADLSEAQSMDSSEKALDAYRKCLQGLSDLIEEHPNYASARNNRAQVLRRLYGDAMLLNHTMVSPMPLIPEPEQQERISASKTFLDDIKISIALLMPAPPTSSKVSRQTAKTLSMAYTQRAAVYLKTSKLLGDRKIDVDTGLSESGWDRVGFEEAASHDLALGGRFGNEIAKGLAVSVNPTAKLCGQMVREAMKKEYGESFAR